MSGEPRPGAAYNADSTSWPLVGRDDELALARHTMERGASVVLSGPPGVGKSRLAREVLDAVATDGRAIWITATLAASTVPLGAVAHLVPSGAISDDRDATLRGIVSALDRHRTSGRLVLGVDDAHLLDDASAALVHLLVNAHGASAVVTFRRGEAVPDAIGALWKGGEAPFIALQALARAEADALLTSVLDGPVDRVTLQRLWAASAGNVLYLRELVLDGLAKGALVREQGTWRWSGPLDPGDRLQDLIARRMGTLDADERRAFEIIAVGEPLDAALLRALGIADTAATLEHRGIVTTRRTETREVGPAHPLFGEVLRAQIPPLRLDEIRRSLARALESTGSTSPHDAFRIVLWRVEAGDRAPIEQLRAAARRAWALWAPETAERLARAALASAPDLEAGYLLGEALMDQGRPAEALAVFDSVQELSGPDRIRVGIAIGQAGVLAHQFGRLDDARAAALRVRSQITDPRAARVLDGELALLRALQPGETGDDGATATTAATDAEPLEPNAVLALALDDTTAGRLTRAIATADRCLASVDTWIGEFPTIAMVLRMTREWAIVLRGAPCDADAEAEAQYERALLDDADYPRAMWCLVRGLVAIFRGHAKPGIGVLRETVTVFERANPGFLRPAHAYLTMLTALDGDVVAARVHEELAAAANRSLDRVFGVDVMRATAYAAAARGELSAARQHARAAADFAASRGQPVLEACAWHDVARFGDPQPAADRLDALCEMVDGNLVVAMHVHANGLARGDAGLLDAASREFASRGFDLFAAEAASAAARIYRRTGRKGSAFAARDAAREYAAGCGVAHTPLLVLDDLADELTPREREIAEMAAAGHTSREIAQRLGITARTVDNLLGRTYAKLGISGRRDLAPILGELALPHGARRVAHE